MAFLFAMLNYKISKSHDNVKVIITFNKKIVESMYFDRN